MFRSTTIARHRHLLAGAVAFALVSVFVLRTSDAAFTAEFTNDGSRFSTGDIALNGDYTLPLFGDTEAIEAAALVNTLGLKPGDTRTACIVMTYTDTLTNTQLTDVSLTVDIGDDLDGLADKLQVQVAVEADCGATPSYGTAVALPNLPEATGWSPAASGESRGFHFQVTVQDDAPADAVASNVALTWSVSTTS